MVNKKGATDERNVGKAASKVLRDGRISGDSKSAAGSALSQGAARNSYNSGKTKITLNDSARAERRKALTKRVLNDYYDDYHKARR